MATLALGNHAQKQRNAGLAQKYYADAAEKLGKIDQLPSSIVMSARIAAGIEIARALAYAKAGDMDRFITSFEKGVRATKELGSGKRLQEARDSTLHQFGW